MNNLILLHQDGREILFNIDHIICFEQSKNGIYFVITTK